MLAAEIRAAVFELKTVPLARIAIPEWPKIAVYLREMRGDVYDQYLDLCKRSRDDKWPEERFMSEVAVLVVCDEAGTVVFHNGDAETLAAGSPAPLRRIVRRVARLNALYELSDREIEGN